MKKQHEMENKNPQKDVEMSLFSTEANTVMPTKRRVLAPQAKLNLNEEIKETPLRKSKRKASNGTMIVASNKSKKNPKKRKQKGKRLNFSFYYYRNQQ